MTEPTQREKDRQFAYAINKLGLQQERIEQLQVLVKADKALFASMNDHTKKLREALTLYVQMDEVSSDCPGCCGENPPSPCIYWNARNVLGTAYKKERV